MRSETALTLSVVVPAYNEAEGIDVLHQRLLEVLGKLGLSFEIIYVDDGSADQTLEKLLELQSRDQNVTLVSLSRNFGKEIALSAGLDHVRGDAAIVIDADLQDPPELIPEMVRKWREGFDVVYARRLHRDGESLLKKSSASAFYRLMQHVGRTTIPRDTGDFRLLSRRAVKAVCQLRESHRFMKGLFSWIGFKQTEVTYKRDARFAGTTKWSYWKLWNLALEGITSFTVAPLKLATYIGLLASVGAFAYAAVIIAQTLYYGRDVPGYASIMTVVLLLGGLQLLALGIVGEYLGRTFNEVKNRPLYLVDQYKPAQALDQHVAAEEPVKLGPSLAGYRG